MGKKVTSQRTQLLVYKAPFEYKEAFKVLRTNIQFSSADKNIKKLAITSTGPCEGKTTVTVNLALTMAEAGLKVLLVDSDLRKPRVHKLLDLPVSPGITNLLTKQSGLSLVINRVKGYDSLHVITCGVVPPNPAELIGSNQMETFIKNVEDNYDYIIFDTPPVSLVTDAAVLSKYLDGVIMVLGYGRTVKDAALYAKQQLESVGANIIGCVFNFVDGDAFSSHGYRYKYGGYKYKYSGGYYGQND